MKRCRIYSRWRSIRQKCLNPNCEQYKDYGGRGITMYEPWVNDFQAFYSYFSKLPNYGKKGFSIDRINNDGNYEPGNLRYTNNHYQTCNSRIRSDNKSGYKGVHYHKAKGRFISRIQINNKKVHLGYFLTAIEAYEKRKEYIKENNLTEYKE